MYSKDFPHSHYLYKGFSRGSFGVIDFLELVQEKIYDSHAQKTQFTINAKMFWTWMASAIPEKLPIDPSVGENGFQTPEVVTRELERKT